MNAIPPRWLSGWGLPGLRPSPPLIQPLHARRDRSGVPNRRFVFKPRTLQGATGRVGISEVPTLLLKRYLLLSNCQGVPRKVVRKKDCGQLVLRTFCAHLRESNKKPPLVER